MKAFYNTLDSEHIDIAYFADEYHESFEDLQDAILEGGGFDVEIIYYSNAIKYLQENDPSLRNSLEIAAEYGYEVKNLNSEILASLLAGEHAREDFFKLSGQIEDFFEELNSEENDEE
jgi:hypothetical protein